MFLLRNANIVDIFVINHNFFQSINMNAAGMLAQNYTYRCGLAVKTASYFSSQSPHHPFCHSSKN